jgi:hypothetical protein
MQYCTVRVRFLFGVSMHRAVPQEDEIHCNMASESEVRQRKPVDGDAADEPAVVDTQPQPSAPRKTRELKPPEEPLYQKVRSGEGEVVCVCVSVWVVCHRCDAASLCRGERVGLVAGVTLCEGRVHQCASASVRRRVWMGVLVVRWLCVAASWGLARYVWGTHCAPSLQCLHAPFH